MKFKNAARHKVAIICLLVALAVIPTVIVLAVASSSDDPPGVAIGAFAPGISGTTIDGGNVNLASYRESDSWVVVNFFATWCTPCIAEHGELSRFRAEAEYPAEVISVIFNQPESRARDFFGQYGGNWPVLAGNTRTVVLNYRIISVPETYLIAPSGRVAAHWRGPITADDIFKRVDRILAANSSSSST